MKPPSGPGERRPPTATSVQRIVRDPVVHIGYHKTASTWLQVRVFPRLTGIEYGHPLVRRFSAALAGAPDESFMPSSARSMLRQLGWPAGRRLLISDEGISGSLWDGYGVGLRSAERLHAVLGGGARILVLVRRQDEMLRSVHAQYVNEGGTRSLRQFLAGRGVEGSEFSLRHLEYDRLVARYVELFGRDRVWVAPYEYLWEEPDRLVGELCRFIGLHAPANLSRAWPNRSLCKPALWLLRSWNRLFRASRFNADPLVCPLPGAPRMRRILQERVDALLRPLAWDPLRRREEAALGALAAGFAESNARLQRLCPYSLARWSYPLAGRGLFEEGPLRRAAMPETGRAG